MHPEIFGFVKSYGLMLDISFLVGIVLCVRRGRRHGLSTDTILSFCFAVLVSSLVGVRLFYVLTHLQEFSPWYRAFFLWDGGLTLYGGIILAIITVWVMCRRRGIPFLLLADVMAPALALGLGISRIGCFLSGCCYGLPTDLGWGVHFPAGCPATNQLGAQPLHPAQLYSSAGGFLVFGLLLLAERRGTTTGVTFGRFLILYGLARFLVEFTRFAEARMIGSLGLNGNQWFSLLMVVGGVVLLLSLRRSGAVVHAK